MFDVSGKKINLAIFQNSLFHLLWRTGAGRVRRFFALVCIGMNLTSVIAGFLF